VKNTEKPESQPEFFSRQIQEARRFYLDLTPPPEVALAVVCGGYEHCAPDYAIHRATFPFYSVEFVANGTGTLVLNGREYSLFPGAVFSYGPGVAQDFTTDPKELLEKYFVDFTGRRAPQLLEQYGLPPGTFARVFALGEIQAILDGLIQDGLRGTALSDALCAAHFEYLIVRVADSLMPWETRQTPAFATYLRCRRYIAEHFENLKSLEQIAEQCHVDRAYLCRLFHRFDGQTPYRFLMRLKMNLAAERLQNPGVLVKQIASQLGFDDQFHFSRVFKNTLGYSPEAFRRLR
jgi:AraC-like DNA-binding protein